MRILSRPKLFRVVNALEDGRKIYLSSNGKVLIMPRREAAFWIEVARRVHSITIDEMVYSKDLRFYDHRSRFIERLAPFVRVIGTGAEPAGGAVDPEAFIVGGILAGAVDHQLLSQPNDGGAVFLAC